MWARVMTFVGIEPSSDVTGQQVRSSGDGKVDVTQLSFDERVAMMKESSRPLFEEDDNFGATLTTFQQHQATNSAEGGTDADDLQQAPAAGVTPAADGMAPASDARDNEVDALARAEAAALAEVF